MNKEKIAIYEELNNCEECKKQTGGFCNDCLLKKSRLKIILAAMRSAQILSYEELIEWAKGDELNNRGYGEDEMVRVDKLISHLKGRIEELKKDE